MARRQSGVSGKGVEDSDVAAVLNATRHLDPYSQNRVLRVASEVVEHRRNGHRPTLSYVSGVTVEPRRDRAASSVKPGRHEILNLGTLRRRSRRAA
jgi:hypothetical protein